MLELTSQRWAELNTGRGSARWVPSLIESTLRRVTDDQVDDFVVTLSDLCHDWSTYDATYAATPHLIAACHTLSADSPLRLRILSMLGWFSACLDLNGTKAPKDLIESHYQSFPAALELAAGSLPYSQPGRKCAPIIQTRALLGACAAFRRDFPLSFMLYELDAGGIKCLECNSFFHPFKSTMNPYFVEGKDG